MPSAEEWASLMLIAFGIYSSRWALRRAVKGFWFRCADQWLESAHDYRVLECEADSIAERQCCAAGFERCMHHALCCMRKGLGL